MDCALWGPTDGPGNCLSVHDESSYQIEGGSWSDFYYVYGLDVIEEDALNEKACIQVLRILIRNADAEIIKFEEDLMALHCQLACTDEEWSDICIAVLREKIDYLETSIQNLRDKTTQEGHDFGLCPCTDQPAQRMPEIVQSLLKNYFQSTDKQPVDVVKESASDDMKHVTVDLMESKKLIDSASHTIQIEEVKEPVISPSEEHEIFVSSFKPQVEKTNSLAYAKITNNHVEGLSPESSPDATGLNIKEVEAGLTPSADSTCPKSSSISDKLIIAQLEKKKKLSKFNSNLSDEAVTDSYASSVPEMKPGKPADPLENNKPGDTIFKDSMEVSLRHALNNSIEKNGASKLHVNVTGRKRNRNFDGKPTEAGKVKICQKRKKAAKDQQSCLKETEDTAVQSCLEFVKKKRKTASMNAQKQQLQREHHFSTEIVPEPCLAMAFGLKISPLGKFRKWNSFFSDKTPCLGRSEKRIRTENYPSLNRDTKLGAAVGFSRILDTESHKKRKASLSSPVLKEDKRLGGLQITLAKFNEDGADSTEEGHRLSECSITGSENVKLLPCPAPLHVKNISDVDVETLKVVDLRAIAKQLNLAGRSKPRRKAELLEWLGLKPQV